MSRRGRFGKYGEVKRRSRLKNSQAYRGRRFGSKARLTGDWRRKSHRNKYISGSKRYRLMTLFDAAFCQLNL